ncbi:MAG: glutathione S-transferase [Notoacmeibacter sp.]|nr:glutathione S-transferase [Notoacmeibacter sp.]
MKIYDGGKAPNPRRVRIYLAEKGIEVPLEPVDMGALEHKSDKITRRNPLQRLPVLEFDDGTTLSETVAICRYFEELHPEPPLMGADALDKATVEMWQRRVELHFLTPVAHAFRHIHPAMKEWEIPQIADWGEANKPKAIEFIRLLDEELAKREFIAGDRFTIADITATVATDFMKPARISIPEDATNFIRWYEAMKARPSYGA